MDLDGLWNAGEEFTIGGHTLRALSRANRFLHACCHATLGDWPLRLGSLRDVAEMLRAADQDGAALIRIATGWGVEAVVAAAVVDTHRLLGTAPTGELSSWAQRYVPNRREERRLALYAHADKTFAAQALATVPTLPRLRDKAAYVRALVLPDVRYTAGPARVGVGPVSLRHPGGKTRPERASVTSCVGGPEPGRGGAGRNGNRSVDRVSSSVTSEHSPAVPPPLRRPIGAVAVLAALMVAVLAALYSGDAAPGEVDQWLQSAVEDTLPPPGSGALLIDFVAEPLGAAVLVPLLVALCMVLGRRRLAALAVAGPGLAGVVSMAVKPVVGRTIHSGHLSYPSGHTAVATVLALVLALLLVSLLLAGKLAGVLLVLAAAGAAGAAMAWSQVALGAHYPTDTLGGFCSAVAVVPVTAWLIDQVADRRAVAVE